MTDDLKLLIQSADLEDGSIEVSPSDLKRLAFDDLKPNVTLRVVTDEGQEEPIPGAMIFICRTNDDAIQTEVLISIYRKVWFDDIGLDVYARAFSRALNSLDIELEEDGNDDDTWVHLRYVTHTISAPPLCAYNLAVDTYQMIQEEVNRLLKPIWDAIRKQGLNSPSNCL